jgi:hypothetical protein
LPKVHTHFFGFISRITAEKGKSGIKIGPTNRTTALANFEKPTK